MSDGAPSLPEGLPQVGQTFASRFRIEAVIGQGGMGAVLRAHDAESDTDVALKVMLPHHQERDASLRRFRREAHIIGAIDSPHVARLLDAGEAGGRNYMALELLEGESLQEVMEREGQLAMTAAVDWVLQAAEGVAHAHAHGVVHRDLKPSNLFVAETVDGPVLKVLDFGISKATAELGQGPDSATLTETDSFLGSPTYMSPEQLRSSRDVDARADVWALGVILHRLLTARRPFRGDSPGEYIASVLAEAPSTLRDHVPDAPEDLERVVTRCLDKSASKRFADVGELVEALVSFGGPGAPARLARIEKLLAARRAERPKSTRRELPATAREGAPTARQGLPPTVREGSDEPPPTSDDVASSLAVGGEPVAASNSASDQIERSDPEPTITSPELTLASVDTADAAPGEPAPTSSARWLGLIAAAAAAALLWTSSLGGSAGTVSSGWTEGGLERAYGVWLASCRASSEQPAQVEACVAALVGQLDDASSPWSRAVVAEARLLAATARPRDEPPASASATASASAPRPSPNPRPPTTPAEPPFDFDRARTAVARAANAAKLGCHRKKGPRAHSGAVEFHPLGGSRVVGLNAFSSDAASCVFLRLNGVRIGAFDARQGAQKVPFAVQLMPQ